MDDARLYRLIDLLVGLGLTAMLASALLPDGQLVCMWAEKGAQCAGCGITRSFRNLLGLEPEALVTLAGRSVFGFIIVQLVLRALTATLVSDRKAVPTLLRLDIVLSLISVVVGFWWVLA